jgi:hypothetical protein
MPSSNSFAIYLFSFRFVSHNDISLGFIENFVEKGRAPCHSSSSDFKLKSKTKNLIGGIHFTSPENILFPRLKFIFYWRRLTILPLQKYNDTSYPSLSYKPPLGRQAFFSGRCLYRAEQPRSASHRAARGFISESALAIPTSQAACASY